MSKEEFLEELRQSLTLSGKMSAAEINSNVDYYRAYIEGEIMKGRSEAEVLEELGPARLIAKTLTANIKDDGGRNKYSSSYERGPSGQDQYAGPNEEEAYDGQGQGAKNTVKKVLKGVMIAVVVILCLFLCVFMFRGLFYIAIRFLPLIIIFAVISWILRGGSRGQR